MTAPYIIEVFSVDANCWLRRCSMSGVDAQAVKDYVGVYLGQGISVRVIREGKIVMEGEAC